ncbi:flavodoxin [Paenibacillus agilis]|uniref:Flavodoxin n=1 Tax=Paenibacillus agilis TaxID=3020863 RepID=A0A559IWM2_9BACL|nr:flavodoxin [Paenibacillus agilis]TVX92030.1 flavodoxin [Paenibacillus agilis]
MSQSIILIYASMTGNTEEMKDAVEEGIRELGADVTVKDVMDAQGSDLEAYDVILLGAYTWGDGELPDEFLDFYDEMNDLNLEGKRAAVFGSCDSSYTQYGAAVDILSNKLRELGCTLVHEGLKVELSPSQDEREVCREFGRHAVRALSNA